MTSAREDVHDAFSRQLAVGLQLTVDRNREVRVDSLQDGEQYVVLKDGPEGEPEDLNGILVHPLTVAVEGYVGAKNAEAGPRLNDLAARVWVAAFSDRSLGGRVEDIRLGALDVEFYPLGAGFSREFHMNYRTTPENPYIG